MYEIYLGDIEPEMPVKNYTEFCKLLHQPNHGKNQGAKAKQIARWHELIDFEKLPKGFSYIIHGLKKGVNAVSVQPRRIDYVEKPQKEKKLRETPGKYVNEVLQILLPVLNEKYQKTAVFTNNELYSILGLVNENYSDRDKEDEIAQKLVAYLGGDLLLRKRQVRYIRYWTNEKFRIMLVGTLNALNRRNWITYVRTMSISYTDSDVVRHTSSYRTQITHIEQQIRCQFGQKNMKMLDYNGCYAGYRVAVLQKVKKDLGIDSYKRIWKMQICHDLEYELPTEQAVNISYARLYKKSREYVFTSLCKTFLNDLQRKDVVEMKELLTDDYEIVIDMYLDWIRPRNEN